MESMEEAVIGAMAESLLELLASFTAMAMESETVVGLGKLREMTTMVRCIVALEKEPRFREQRELLLDLKDALYDAEDLVEEMCIGSCKWSFQSDEGFVMSVVKKLGMGWRRSSEIKEIKARLGAIEEKMDHVVRNLMNLGPVNVKGGGGLGVSKKKGDSCLSYSLPCDSVVIGRDADKEALISLLSLNDGNGVSFVCVVGMGGLGKTTLAQLVYNDERISNHFSLKTWACVSDDFDKLSIVRQLLASTDTDSALNWDQLLALFRQTFQAKRCLIVLDDVWSESRYDWVELKRLLSVVGKGSWILVTTRSRMVADAIDQGSVYDLPPLSEEHSWLLFERLAFEPGQGQGQTDDALLEMAKEILQKCGNLPLAIKTVAAFLLGQSKTKWLEFNNSSWSSMSECEDKVMPILELSYRHLDPYLQRCFAYCALFPLDYVIDKDILISLWIAEGYIRGSAAQPIEDVGEEYFMALVNKCFFQVVKQDESGDIISCKLHNLMHDLAKRVASEELLVATSCTNTRKLSQQPRHLAVVDVKNQSLGTLLSESSGIRTFLNFCHPRAPNQFSIDWVSHSGFRYLRVLDLSGLIMNSSLPDTVGGLMHLRYLDLSSNSKLEMLPSSVANLHYLETLRLRECWRLKHLPSFSKLARLRHFEVLGCNSLTHMPWGMHKLTSLSYLPMFVVGEESWDPCSNQLEELRPLSNIRGSLTIRILKGLPLPCHEAKASEAAGYLSTKKHLKNIHIQWDNSRAIGNEEEDGDHDAAFLDNLEPHINCRSLKLSGYRGVRLPSWATQNLVSISLEDCTGLQHLPSMGGHLCCLKVLSLHRLVNLEYVEDNNSACKASSASASASLTSLEMLTLSNLPKLRGWWRSGIRTGKGEEVEEAHQLVSAMVPSFPHLSALKVRECPSLLSLPLCPSLQELDLRRFDQALPSVLFSSSHLWQGPALRRVTIDMVEYLNSLPMESYQQLSGVVIHLSDVESLSTSSNEVFHSPLPSLEFLQISLCSKLKSLSGLGWIHLTALKRLSLSNLPVLDLAVDDTDEDFMPWKCLANLQSLELDYLPKLVKLPLGIQYLTSLQTLEIRICHSLKELSESMGTLSHLKFLCIEACIGLEYLPQSMCYLTSLHKLEILRCSGCLRERCHGVDWPKIQHIPYIYIN